MKITKTSKITGKENSMDIEVSENQLFAWSNGLKIQDAMPNLTPDEREFIMTGSTKEEWDSMFKGDF